MDNKVAVVEFYGIRFPIYKDECGYWTPRVMCYFDSIAEVYDAIEHMMAASFIA